MNEKRIVKKAPVTKNDLAQLLRTRAGPRFTAAKVYAFTTSSLFFNRDAARSCAVSEERRQLAFTGSNAAVDWILPEEGKCLRPASGRCSPRLLPAFP